MSWLGFDSRCDRFFIQVGQCSLWVMAPPTKLSNHAPSHAVLRGWRTHFPLQCLKSLESSERVYYTYTTTIPGRDGSPWDLFLVVLRRGRYFSSKWSLCQWLLELLCSLSPCKRARAYKAKELMINVFQSQ